MNYMAEVAKMLGVEIGEKFEVHGDSHGVFTAKITLDGCWVSIGMKSWEKHNQAAVLRKLLNGEYCIKRGLWKPTYNEKYYSIGPGGVLEPGVWLNDFIDVAMLKLGNCYRTVQEAEANRDKWISFYRSDEVLEV